MLHRLFHLDPQTALQNWHLHLRANLPVAVLLLLVAAAAAYGFFLYRRETTLGRIERTGLAACRVLILSLLLVIIFQPVAQVTLVNQAKPKLLVMVDASDSMAIHDTRKDPEHITEALMALGKSDAEIKAATGMGATPDSAPATTRPDDSSKPPRTTTRPTPGSTPGRSATTAPATQGADDRRGLLANISRLDIARAILDISGKPVWDQLAQSYDVRYFRFARNTEAIATPAGLGAPAEPAWSGATHMGDALSGKEINDPSVGGVVVLSDGASHAGMDPMEAASRLKARGIPVYTMGVGLAKPYDVALAGLIVQDAVFANDLVPIRVQIVSNGYEKRPTTLTVSLDGAEVARKAIVLTGQPQFEELSFKASRTGGTKTLVVSVSPLPDEATADNNTLTRTINVSDDKIKVLFIEGSPRWEDRYLRAVLKRDPRIEVQFITTEGDRDLPRASKEHLARFPEDPKQAFKYDLVILSDARATTFTPGQLERVHELVRDRGGSLIVIAGHKHMPAEYLDTPVRDMLPVYMDQGKWEEVAPDVYPMLTQEGQQSTVMMLTPDEAKNKALWSNVKPLAGVAPLAGAKPSATVWATLSDKTVRTSVYPLIAWQRYGTGKVLYVGSDRLFRLRKGIGDQYHARFWGQAVQFLTLSRLLGENRRIRIEAAGGQVETEQPIELFANVLNEGYEPVSQPAFTVTVERLGQGGQRQPVQLRPVPGIAGFYHGLFVPGLAGRYQVYAADTNRPLGNVADFEATATQGELADPAMREDVLRHMADLTGGKYLTIHDLPDLPKLLEAKATISVIHKELELWDHWLFAALFLILATVEWAWRRKRDLA